MTDSPFRRIAFDLAFSRYPANSRVDPVRRIEALADPTAITAKAEIRATSATVISDCTIVKPLSDAYRWDLLEASRSTFIFITSPRFHRMGGRGPRADLGNGHAAQQT